MRLPDGCDQRAVMQHMLDAAIATRRGVMCSHREPAYAGSAAPGALPHSEAAQEHCIILPLYPQMTRDDQEQVADALQRACAR